MGEYYNGVKLGTCEHLMYITRKEVEYHAAKEDLKFATNQSAGNHARLSDYLTLSHNYCYRFPRFIAGEQECKINFEEIGSREAFDYLHFDYKPILEVWGDIIHNDFEQVTIKSTQGHTGSTYNIPFCLASDKGRALLDTIGAKKLGNQSVIVNIIGERYNEDNPEGYTIFGCAECGEWFAITEGELPEYKEQIRLQCGEKYANLIKHRIK